MAQVIFRKNAKEKTLKPVLVIGFLDMDGIESEQEFEFGCGEDLQNYMTAVLKKDFEVLFEEHELHSKNISDMWIKGISVTGQNEQGRLTVHIVDNYVQGSSIIHEDVMKDENAQKMKEIEAIIKR